MKKYVVALSPLLLSFFISIICFSSFGHGPQDLTDLTFPAYFFILLIILSVLSVGFFINQYKKAKVENNKKAELVILVVVFVLSCVTGFWLTINVIPHFAVSYFRNQLDVKLQIFNQEQMNIKSQTVNQILSNCKTKFTQPVEVLSVAENFQMRLSSGLVTLYIPEITVGDYDYGSLDAGRVSFKSFAQSNLVGQKISIICPSYEDLMQLDNPSPDSPQVLIYFNNKLLNAPPFIPDNFSYGLNLAQEVSNKYPAVLK